MYGDLVEQMERAPVDSLLYIDEICVILSVSGGIT